MDKKTKNALSYLSFIQIKLSCFSPLTDKLPSNAKMLIDQMARATFNRKDEIFSQFPIKIYPSGNESIFID